LQVQSKLTNEFQICKVTIKITINLVTSYTNNVTKLSYSYRWKKSNKVKLELPKKGNSNCNFVTSNELLPIPDSFVFVVRIKINKIINFELNR